MTSPCIDAGDPASVFGDERQPNGGRVNMGAYGNTVEASKSPFDCSSCRPEQVCIEGACVAPDGGTDGENGAAWAEEREADDGGAERHCS